MARKSVDCRDHPSVSNCSVKIEGTEEEVMRIMTRHLVADHGEPDTAEVREMIRASMKDEPEGRSASKDFQAPASIH